MIYQKLPHCGTLSSVFQNLIDLGMKDSEILMFHILEGINGEKNRNETNKTFIERF